jgi:hypothetical protein
MALDAAFFQRLVKFSYRAITEALPSRGPVNAIVIAFIPHSDSKMTHSQAQRCFKTSNQQSHQGNFLPS